MIELGGYVELDNYHMPMLHEGAIALNCARNALAYVLRARNIRKLWIPKLICDSVVGLCQREGVSFTFYSIGLDFLPVQEVSLGENEWFYFVNYYSQFDNVKISEYVTKYKRVIVDQVQSYFQSPIAGVDTLYTCRKYFGVTDGAFLYTEKVLNQKIPVDESFERMQYLLGRYERTASEFYSEYVANEERFATEPIKQMSRLTQNLLHGIDYEHVKGVREENFRYLHKELGEINYLQINELSGTFMYPLLLANGAAIRKQLQNKKIYIPTLWPDVIMRCEAGDIEYQMAENILPLPIDQRYGTEEMMRIVEEIKKCLRI